jgi:hypothetical protein
VYVSTPSKTARLRALAALVAAAVAAVAYALKKRHDASRLERAFDPDAELAASIIDPGWASVKPARTSDQYPHDDRPPGTGDAG